MFVCLFVCIAAAKAKAREARRDARRLGKVEGVPDGPGLERVISHLSTASYLSIEEVGKEVKQKKEKEPSSFTLSNPGRLTPLQVRFISLQAPQHQRYAPVSKRAKPSGIVMLADANPSAEEVVCKVERILVGEEEAPAPEPFVWNEVDE